jgi:hypothetical protein
MEVILQKLDDILESLRPLAVEWQDDRARNVIELLKRFDAKETYTVNDVKALLDKHFDEGILICRLFLALSNDQFKAQLKSVRGDKQIGVKTYRADREAFINDLLTIGLLDAMALEANRKPHRSDILVERLRSGRGSAISGQKRGRGVEDFAEAVVTKVFGGAFDPRCTFTGPGGSAKCDFAIPSKSAPRIVIESKGYGATGSKMTDVLGDIEKIVAAKRPDTALLFFTDGLAWKQRKSDLRKIVDFQNKGDITRIYTYAMADQFEADLRQLKKEFNI